MEYQLNIIQNIECIEPVKGTAPSVEHTVTCEALSKDVTQKR
jgi:hypothetical protein